VTYAEGTRVSLGRSRGEIDDVLRRWRCDQVRWTDDYAQARVVLEFVWRHGEDSYAARMTLKLPDRSVLEKRAINRQTGRLSEPKLARLMAERGQEEMRAFALWIKACLAAVDAGIVDAATVFLPFLTDPRTGETVAEFALPRMRAMLAEGVVALLPAGPIGGTQ